MSPHILRGGLLLLLALAWSVYAPRAHAADSCTVATTGVNFGTYDITSASPLDGQGNITVDCQGNPLVVGISLGAGGSGSYANRRMTNGSDPMFYNLYLDAGRSIIFGDGSGGSLSALCTTGVTLNGCTGSNPTGGTRRAVRPVYGRINASQDVSVGLYTDTITYTVTF